MKVRLKTGDIQPNVDMTPMIDIVFQLILFFLVSTTFVMLPGIKIKLPSSTTAEGTNTAGITITVNEEGLLYFNDKQISMYTLGKELMAFDTRGSLRETVPVSLEADDKVTNGTIVRIFDIIRESGFTIINLRTISDRTEE